jgi:hypothetical protein
MRRLALLFLASAALPGDDLEREVEAFVAAIDRDRAAGVRTAFSKRIDLDSCVAEIEGQRPPAGGEAFAAVRKDFPPPEDE